MGVAVRSWSIVAWTVVVAAGLFHLYVAFARPGGPEGMSDFGVYRLAAQAVVAGSDPYGIASPLNGDRFVYPPFAALLLAPLALLPEPAARLVWTGAQWALVVLLAAVIRPHLSAPAVRRLPGPLHTPCWPRCCCSATPSSPVCSWAS
jgi:alpha-1,2-mannosyltransferase